MWKRTGAACLGLLLALTPFMAVAEDAPLTTQPQEEVQEEDTQAEETLEELNLEEDVPAMAVVASITETLPAKSAILMDQASGQILFEQNADEQLSPASVTKIMTLLLVMEALDSGRISLEDMVTCSENANSMGGSQIWLKVGEQMSVNDLLKAVAISSANDASVALGEHIAGSELAFIDMMNARAKELGMVNTKFQNCTGLDEEGHLTTARDVAVMSRSLMKYPLIAEYSTVWMDSLRGGETELVNTNKLVRFYDGCTGLKTGTTSGAGSCLSATATRGDLSLISVVMGCPTSDERFASARGLLDFGFANYTSVTPPAIDAELTPVPVIKGTLDKIMPTYKNPGTFVVDKNLKDSITQQVKLAENVEAPVEAGQVLGKVEVMLEGEVLGSYTLVASQPVERMTFGKAFGILLKEAVRMTNSPAADSGGSRLGGPDGALSSQEGGEPSGDISQSESALDASEPPAASDGETQNGDSSAVEAAEPCPCGKDTCYCADIGNVCGCLTE